MRTRLRQTKNRTSTLEHRYSCQEQNGKCIKAVERAESLGHLSNIAREREKAGTCDNGNKVLNMIHSTCSQLVPRNGWQLCQSRNDEMSCELACGKNRIRFDPGECMCRSGGKADIECLERKSALKLHGRVCCVSEHKDEKAMFSSFQSAEETCVSRASAVFCT